MLSGWLRAGYSRSDPAGGRRNYLLSEKHGFQLLDSPFAGTRPDYAAHGAHMLEIHCQLTLSAVDVPVDGPYIVHEPASPTTSRPEMSVRDARPSDETWTRDSDADSPDPIA